MTYNLLNLIIWIPILLGFIVSFMRNYPKVSSIIALFTALVSFLLSVWLFMEFNENSHELQFVSHMPWIESLNINYSIGVDGISMPFIVLNNLTTLLVIILGFGRIKERVSLYNGMFLVMTGIINGAFCAADAMLFYIFFESMLIPLYLIIGIWGGPNRVYASIKFFLYTFFGSLLMLVAFIYLNYISNGSFSIFDYYHTKLSIMAQVFLFVAFFVAFGVKIPMFPLHTWLPDAYVEAPTGGTIILSAVTVKLGGYGLLRFLLPILPDVSIAFADVMIILSLIAIIYFSFIAIIQKNIKKMVAYGSIAHMGFVTLGCFLFTKGILNLYALEGVMFQMLSHGFVAAGMFACVGILNQRLNTNNVNDFGGVANKMPIFAVFFMLFALANIGLPGTSGFVGEFMIIMGAIQSKFIYGIIAATTLVLGASYTLWMYKKAIFGEVVSVEVNNLKDINCQEFIVLASLAIMVLLMGIYPDLFAVKMHASLQELINNISISKQI